MSFVIGIIMLAVGAAGFVAGYALRSHLSHQRRMNARRSRLHVPSSGRTLDPPDTDA
jgi:hypothetical protein